MSCNDHDKMNPVVHALYHVKEWDKKILEKIEKKFNLTAAANQPKKEEPPITL